MSDAMQAQTITIAGHGGDEIEAYLARPMREGKHPGVVVIHHMPGYDRATKEIARTFAVHGYAASVPEPVPPLRAGGPRRRRRGGGPGRGRRARRAVHR